jgi:hypothetical protein
MNQNILDLEMGDLNEELIEQIIIDVYNFKPNKTEKNHPMDFYNNDYYFEVKSRRCNHDTYPTTMIGLNKIEFAYNTNRKVVFLFSFDDGVYQYIFDKNDNFNIGIGGRNDRGKPEYKKYIYIPINKLVKID